MKPIHWAFACLGLLTGCAAIPEQARAPVLTTAQARAMLLQERSRLFKDPDSIRDTRIGPLHTPAGSPDSPAVCLELNAKNSLGGYTGIKRHGVSFTNGMVQLFEDPQPPNYVCDPMMPWPEFNGSASRR